MRRSCPPILCSALLFATHLVAATPSASLPPAAPSAVLTDWQLKPSLKYDAICLLNALSGDPYYLQFYKAEYDHFHPLFTPQEQKSFTELKRIIKDQAGGIISASLALYYSAVPDESLPEMIATAHDSSKLKLELHKTTYWDDEGWKTYEEAQLSIEAAFIALNRVGFATYWEQNIRPEIAARIAELSGELPAYDIVPAIERHLGFKLSSHTVVVYLLAYSEPHGIRITGLRFLTHVSYPFKIVLHNAIHEMMHPPYDAHAPAIAQAIEQLGRDPFIADKVQHHNPSFGYNTVPGYVEEDSVQALEEIISEEFGVGREPRSYWKDQDDGMHVLAMAIYVDYKAAFKSAPVPFTSWFPAAVNSGQLRGANLQKTVGDFLAGTSLQ